MDCTTSCKGWQEGAQSFEFINPSTITCHECCNLWNIFPTCLYVYSTMCKVTFFLTKFLESVVSWSLEREIEPWFEDLTTLKLPYVWSFVCSAFGHCSADLSRSVTVGCWGYSDFMQLWFSFHRFIDQFAHCLKLVEINTWWIKWLRPVLHVPWNCHQDYDAIEIWPN